MADAKTKKTTVIVTDLKVIHKGTNKNGHDYTIYQVLATKPDGSKIVGPDGAELNLRSFQELPKHQPVEVTVERFDSEQYGTSYTLKTKSGGDKMGARVKDLEAKVQTLSERLDGLAAQLARGATAAPASAGQQQQAPTPPGPQTPPPMPAGGLPDDDIPF